MGEIKIQDLDSGWYFVWGHPAVFFVVDKTGEAPEFYDYITEDGKKVLDGVDLPEFQTFHNSASFPLSEINLTEIRKGKKKWSGNQRWR